MVEVPQERDQERIAAQRVDVPVPPVVEEIAAVAHRAPQKRVAAQRLDIPAFQ